jgi:hypothetical protein
MPARQKKPQRVNRGFTPPRFKFKQSMKLADFLDGLAQRRPFFVQAFVFNLPELGLGDIKFLGHDLSRPGHVRNHVLGGDQAVKDLSSLL